MRGLPGTWNDKGISPNWVMPSGREKVSLEITLQSKEFPSEENEKTNMTWCWAGMLDWCTQFRQTWDSKVRCEPRREFQSRCLEQVRQGTHTMERGERENSARREGSSRGRFETFSWKVEALQQDALETHAALHAGLVMRVHHWERKLKGKQCPGPESTGKTSPVFQRSF